MRKRLASSLLLAMVTASPFTWAVAAAAAASELPEDWQERLKLGARAYDRGENRPAYDIFFRMMNDGANTFGPSDGRMVKLYTNVGETSNQLNADKYGEECLKKALNIAEKGFGATSFQAVPSLIDLGQLYVTQGKDAQAQPLFKRALSIVDKPDDDTLQPYVLVIETNLGSMYYAQGNYAFSEPHFKRALDVSTKVLGPGHKWTTTIGGMYASCLHAQGRKKEAKVIEQAALAKANEAQSPFSAWNKQIGLADTALANKRFPAAEAALKRALQFAQELPAEPMLQVLALTKYGQFYLLQDKIPLAIEKLKTAQGLADTALGLDDQMVLAHAKKLADLEKSKDQCADAEPLYARLTANAKKQHGPESEEYLNAVSDLADLYNQWAQYHKAVTYYTKLLAVQEIRAGATSEKLIPTLVTLATATQNDSEYFAEANDKAEKYLRRAEQIATEHPGKNSKELILVWDALSRYYQKRFDWEKAVKTYSQIVAATEKSFGPESAEALAALEEYVIVLKAGAMRDKAELIEKRIAKLKAPKTAPDD